MSQKLTFGPRLPGSRPSARHRMQQPSLPSRLFWRYERQCGSLIYPRGPGFNALSLTKKCPFLPSPHFSANISVTRFSLVLKTLHKTRILMYIVLSWDCIFLGPGPLIASWPLIVFGPPGSLVLVNSVISSLTSFHEDPTNQMRF